MEVCGDEGADAGGVLWESVVWSASCEERKGGGWERGGELQGEEDYKFEELRREGWCLLLERQRCQC